MTSGGAVHYKSMFDAGSQIVAKEGTKSLFKGAGANILRGVAGAGVLSLYDKLQELMFGKVYSVRRRLLQSRPKLTWEVGWFRLNGSPTYTHQRHGTPRHTDPLPLLPFHAAIVLYILCNVSFTPMIFSSTCSVSLVLFGCGSGSLTCRMWDTLRSSALALRDHDHEDRDLRHHAISAEFVVQYPGSQRSIPPRIERFVTRNLSPS